MGQILEVYLFCVPNDSLDPLGCHDNTLGAVEYQQRTHFGTLSHCIHHVCCQSNCRDCQTKERLVVVRRRTAFAAVILHKEITYAFICDNMNIHKIQVLHA